MKKFLIQFCTFLILFFGTWVLLSRIPFTNAVDFKKFSKHNEHKLGEKFIDFLKKTNTEITSDSAVTKVKFINNRICLANQIDTNTIQIFIFKNPEINAFAIPGNMLIIYSGLIEFCKTPEELAAVMAHEMAHIEKKHVVKKLSKEIGIGMLTTLAGGNSGSEIIKETIKRISSTAFDRTMEKEADFTAVRYLVKSHIDPEQFANMMFRLSSKTDVPESMQWLNTHPNSKERASDILLQRKNFKIQVVPLMDDSRWHQLQHEVNKQIE